jgi:hypothetical protein
MGQLITLKTYKPIRSFEVFDALGRTVHSSSGSTFSVEKTGWYMLGLIFEDGTRRAAKFHILH